MTLMLSNRYAGRETFLVPMAWENDWPVINGGKSIKLEAEGPGLYLKEDDLHWKDDFKGKLKLGWYRKSKQLETLSLGNDRTGWHLHFDRHGPETGLLLDGRSPKASSKRITI
jgi:beta-xylosidase